MKTEKKRCGECVLCHHAWEYSKGGSCAFYVTGRETPEGVEQVMCGCKCVFPATEAPDANGLLDKAARIAYDMIVSGRSAKEVSIAIHVLKVATTGAGTERDELADECQRRMDAVVEAAAEWHQSGREGDNTWFDKAQILSDAIDRLLELRDSPAPPAQPADEGENGSECLACGGPATDPYCVDCTERYQAMIEPSTPTTGAGAREEGETNDQM